MSDTGLIVRPPRVFQLSLLFVFQADTRSDAELSKACLHLTTVALELAANVKAAGVTQLATLPPGMTQ